MTKKAAGPDFRVGLIGVGPATEIIARSYRYVSGAAVVAVADANAERAAKLAARLGVAAYGDYRDMIAQGGVDAVEIHGRADEHLAVAQAACQMKKHFAVHKPLALSRADARAIIGAADAAGVRAMMIDPLMHHPLVLAAKAKLDEALVGEVQMLRWKSHAGGASSFGAALDPAKFSGDAGHFLLAPAYDKAAAIEFLLGPIAEVSGYGGAAVRMISFKFAAPGRFGVHEAVYSPDLSMQTEAMPVDNGVEITGTDGVLWVRNLTATMVEAPKLMLKRKSEVTVWDDKAEYDFAHVLAAVRNDWVAFLRGGKARATLADGLRALTVNLAAEAAVRESRPIHLEKFRQDRQDQQDQEDQILRV
jgi:predicted dehydrogenase